MTLFARTCVSQLGKNESFSNGPGPFAIKDIYAVYIYS